MTNDPWHFKRRTLTGRVLEVLTRGPVQALSLFAPRRAGKTEFLIRDLPPRAESLGHRVVYASARRGNAFRRTRAGGASAAGTARDRGHGGRRMGAGRSWVPAVDSGWWGRGNAGFAGPAAGRW